MNRDPTLVLLLFLVVGVFLLATISVLAPYSGPPALPTDKQVIRDQRLIEEQRRCIEAYEEFRRAENKAGRNYADDHIVRSCPSR